MRYSGSSIPQIIVWLSVFKRADNKNLAQQFTLSVKVMRCAVKLESSTPQSISLGVIGCQQIISLHLDT